MRKTFDSQLGTLVLGLLTYSSVRLSSYLLCPRPYLWRHAVVDVCGVALVLLMHRMVRELQSRNEKW